MAGFRIRDCTSQRAPGRLIRRIDKLMRGLVDERLSARIGISYAGWATLKLVGEGVVRTPGELARELGYTSGAATRLIDSLEAPGLLGRVRDDVDRRVVRLTLTEDGAALVERGLPIALDLWNEMVSGFSQQEADQFVELLLRLLAAVEGRSGTPALAEAAE